MRKIVILFFIISLHSYAQHLSKQEQKQLSDVLDKSKVTVKPIKIYTPITISNDKLTEIKLELGSQKSIPKEFEKQILTALSYYPELKNIHIEFIRSNIKTTMACRPTTASLTKRYNREYIITIDNDNESQGIILDDVPYNAQIGVIGHELGHIVDYESRSSVNIAGLGVNYATGHYSHDFEKGVDKLAIKKGLGWQLHDWADFVLNKSKASKEYKEFKRKTYLTPQEIKQEISKDRQYNFAYSNGFWKNDFMIEVWGVCFGLCISFIFQSDFRKLVLKHLKVHV
jgi:hypothetical protein